MLCKLFNKILRLLFVNYYCNISILRAFGGPVYVSHCVKSVHIRSFLVLIIPHSDSIRRDTEYHSVFNPNTGKYTPEKLRIRTLFTKCLLQLHSQGIWRRFQTILSNEKHTFNIISKNFKDILKLFQSRFFCQNKIIGKFLVFFLSRCIFHFVHQ